MALIETHDGISAIGNKWFASPVLCVVVAMEPGVIDWKPFPKLIDAVIHDRISQVLQTSAVSCEESISCYLQLSKRLYG